MQQVLTFPEPITGLIVRPDQQEWTDEEYWAFCEANPQMRIERTAKGEIVVMPPAGGESGGRNADVIAELNMWARKDGRGKGFDATVQFFLPDGSGLSPDAAWVSFESLSRLPKAERKRFLRLSPEFVVEVLSPSDRLKGAKAKMEQWISNGVQLAWLIDGDAETIYIYRKGQPPEIRHQVKEIAAEGPVAGFVLDLEPIWRGL
jgi:Uma2 family endonuclease